MSFAKERTTVLTILSIPFFMGMITKSTSFIFFPDTTAVQKDTVFMVLDNPEFAMIWALVLLVAVCMCLVSFVTGDNRIGRFGMLMAMPGWFFIGYLYVASGLWLALISQAIPYVIYLITAYYYLGKMIFIKDF